MTPSLRRPPRVELLEDRAVPAAVGALDPSFDTDGIQRLLGAPTEVFNAVAVQPDGGIVAVGTTNQGGTNDFLIVRYKPDGTLDAAFNGNTGRRVINLGGDDQAFDVLIQPDGMIVVAGQGGGAPIDFAVARMKSDGTPDNSFSTDGQNTYALGNVDIARAVGLQSDGTLVVAGYSNNGGTNDFTVIRVNGATGAQIGGATVIDFAGDDKAFGLDVYGPGANLDKVVVVGQGAGAPVDFAVARLNANGTLDNKASFAIGNVDVATGVAIQPDGNVVVGGFSNTGGTNDFVVIRVTTGMTLDATFNAAGTVPGGPGIGRYDFGQQDTANAVALQPDGKIVAAGTFDDGSADFAVLRLNPDGTRDASFNATGTTPGQKTQTLGATESGNGVALDNNDRVVVVGSTAAAADGGLIRLIGSVEKGSGVAASGLTNGTVQGFIPNAAGALPAAPSFTSTPFGALTANVRSAIGDINGDGVDDGVLVTGPGVPIRVTVISGVDATTVLVPAFDPFGGNFTGGGFVSVGDFDLDGKAEFAVTPDQGGGPRVTIFTRNPDGTTTTKANFFGIDDPNFRGGARSAVGDVNGDGVPDIAVSAGFLGGPRTALFDGKTTFTTPTRLINDFFAFPGTDAETLRNGVFVAAGDVNGDGFADLIFGGGPGGAPRVFILSGALVSAGNVSGAQAAPIGNFFVAGNSADRGGVRLAAVDLDGDHKADVVAGSGEGSPAKMRVYLGKNVTTSAEPATFQDVTLFGGGALAGGVFVG